MADEYYLIKGSTLTAIGDAIRYKEGSTATINPVDMPASINNACDIQWDKGYNVGFNDGASSELDAFYDLEMYGSADGLEFWIYNCHPSYELEIEVEIYNNAEGGGLSTIVATIPPQGEYYWTSSGDDTVLLDSSSNFVNDWEVDIRGVEWIK